MSKIIRKNDQLLRSATACLDKLKVYASGPAVVSSFEKSKSAGMQIRQGGAKLDKPACSEPAVAACFRCGTHRAKVSLQHRVSKHKLFDVLFPVSNADVGFGENACRVHIRLVEALTVDAVAPALSDRLPFYLYRDRFAGTLKVDSVHRGHSCQSNKEVVLTV